MQSFEMIARHAAERVEHDRRQAVAARRVRAAPAGSVRRRVAHAIRAVADRIEAAPVPAPEGS